MLLVPGFSTARTAGWSAASTVSPLLAGVAALAVFVLLQHRVAHPMLPLRIVVDRRRGGSLLGVALSGIGMFAVFLFVTFYLQDTHGWSPLATGAAFLPMVGAITVTSTAAAPPLMPRYGPRTPIAGGSLLGAAGLFWLSTLTVSSSYAHTVLPALIVLGLGMGLIFGAGFTSATAGVRPGDAGVASAVANAGQQIASALGAALLSSVALQASLLRSRHPVHPDRRARRPRRPPRAPAADPLARCRDRRRHHPGSAARQDRSAAQRLGAVHHCHRRS